jgi:hypothetical protein
MEGFSRGLSPSQVQSNSKLMLFGDQDHTTYLGCLNCSEYSGESVFNTYGKFGNKYSATSIWNEYGKFGSHYGDESPWNAYANHPPVIVDGAGNFYGYFTVNKYFPKRTTIPSLLQLLDSQ